jgi:hypothetical protein
LQRGLQVLAARVEQEVLGDLHLIAVDLELVVQIVRCRSVSPIGLPSEVG